MFLSLSLFWNNLDSFFGYRYSNKFSYSAKKRINIWEFPIPTFCHMFLVWVASNVELDSRTGKIRNICQFCTVHLSEEDNVSFQVRSYFVELNHLMFSVRPFQSFPCFADARSLRPAKNNIMLKKKAECKEHVSIYLSPRFRFPPEN